MLLHSSGARGSLLLPVVLTRGRENNIKFPCDNRILVRGAFGEERCMACLHINMEMSDFRRSDQSYPINKPLVVDNVNGLISGDFDCFGMHSILLANSALYVSIVTPCNTESTAAPQNENI